jgi:hypothetical protein
MRAAPRTAPPIDSVAACGYGLGGCGHCGLLLPVAPRHCLSPGPGAAPDAAGATDAANTHTAKSSTPRRFISVIGLSFRDAGFPPGPDPGRGRRLDESIIPGRQGRCKVRCGSQVGLRASQWSADYTPDEHRGGAISMELADLIRETAMVLINHLWHLYRNRVLVRHHLRAIDAREARLREDLADEKYPRIDWLRSRVL